MERNVPEKYVILMQDMLSNKGAQWIRRKGQLQRGCAVAPHIGGEGTNTRIHDVCGRHCNLWR